MPPLALNQSMENGVCLLWVQAPWTYEPRSDVQHQPFQLPGFESLQGNHHGIRPDWQGQDFEAAGSIRGNCFRESRVQVLNCDLRSHNCRSSAVRDDAENGAFIGDLPRYNSY